MTFSLESDRNHASDFALFVIFLLLERSALEFRSFRKYASNGTNGHDSLLERYKSLR